jgi:hypothetical protein
VNLLADDIETIKKNTQTSIDAGKEVGLKVNTEETKYMLPSRQQNAGQNYDITDVLKMWINSDIWEQL